MPNGISLEPDETSLGGWEESDLEKGSCVDVFWITPSFIVLSRKGEKKEEE